MKGFAAIILFFSAVAAINNFAGLPLERFQQVNLLLSTNHLVAAKPSKQGSAPGLGGRLKSVHLNDFLQDNGFLRGAAAVNPGEDKEDKESVENMAKVLHMVIPAIKELKKARDNETRRHAQEFAATLRHSNDDNLVKAVLGKHLMEQDRKCKGIKLKFAKRVKKAGLFDKLGPDDLDFTEVMANVLEDADISGADVFEVFVHKVYEHGISSDPGVGVILAIGGLVAEAAGDPKMDGLVKAIAEEIETGDPEGNFEASFADKIIGFIYSKKNRRCTGSLVESLKPGKGLKERLLSLIFERCKELKLVRYAVETVLDAIRLGNKAKELEKLSHIRTMALATKVGALMNASQFDLANKEVGEFVMAEIRTAILVKITFHKRLQPKPEPSSSKPSASEIERTLFIEEEADLDRLHELVSKRHPQNK